LQSATRGIKFPNKIMVTRNARWPENITWPPPWTTTQLGPLQYQVMGLLGFNPQFVALENWAATRPYLVILKGTQLINFFFNSDEFEFF
jgi:hypothetical protein